MKSYGADMAVCDYDRRTPLHVAASEGDLNMVKYLMQVIQQDFRKGYVLSFVVFRVRFGNIVD